MCSGGWFVFLDWHIVQVLSLPSQQHGDFNVSHLGRGPPYKCSSLLSILSCPIFEYYLSVVLKNKVASSGLASRDYKIFHVSLHVFLVFALHGAVGYQ